MSKRIVIVGSGIAGLTAAYYAAKASKGAVEIELLEKERTLGGHSLTGATALFFEKVSFFFVDRKSVV